MNILRRPSAGSSLHVGRVARTVTALGVMAVSATGGVLASAGAAHASTPTNYSFNTLDNSNDLTFNQLLGINNHGVIAGYFGSGMAGHPNKGYYLLPGGNQLDYRIENFPGSTQTQVTGMNDRSTQVGFYSPTNTGTDANYAWYSDDNGLNFHPVIVPGVSFSTPAVTQLLGVNDNKVAVGFYNDANGNSHGFTYNIRSQEFSFTTLTGASSLTDTAINDRGQVAGFFTGSGGTVESFVTNGRHGISTFSFQGASMTQAFGLNDFGEVVGTYTVGSGSTAMTHGFTWTAHGGFETVDDPNGMGTATVNGVNDRGDLVGFYTDSAGNVDGMLALPS